MITNLYYYDILLLRILMTDGGRLYNEYLLYVAAKQANRRLGAGPRQRRRR
jgi:hypothetical protein